MEKYKTVILRIKPGTQIYNYLLEQEKNNNPIASKVIMKALNNYIDSLNKKHEEIDIQELKQLMKDVKKSSMKIESTLFDLVIKDMKKGNQDHGN